MHALQGCLPPCNVLITDSSSGGSSSGSGKSVSKVADFGTSRIKRKDNMSLNSNVGTLLYIAPELMAMETEKMVSSGAD